MFFLIYLQKRQSLININIIEKKNPLFIVMAIGFYLLINITTNENNALLNTCFNLLNISTTNKLIIYTPNHTNIVYFSSQTSRRFYTLSCEWLLLLITHPTVRRCFNVGLTLLDVGKTFNKLPILM